MIRLPSINHISQQLQQTLKRFPLPCLSAFILTVFGIYAVHEASNLDDHLWLWQTLMTASLAILFLTALNLAVESLAKQTRGLAMLGGAALMGFYYYTLPNEPDAVGSLWITRHIFLSLGSLVALAWSPYWRTKVSNAVLWRWDTDVLAKLLVTAFFSVVLFAGSALALWSVSALFALDIDEKLYFDLWILAGALFAPLFFLSQVDQAPLKLTAIKTVDPYFAIFAKYIMTPIAGGYMLILYAYTAKILITWEWPKNVLGWLVICFLGVAIFTYFLWTPLLKPSFQKYRRIFWLILVPQILLLFVAIGWRIHAYSWTENRYFVVALGLWLLGTTIYFLLKKEARFKWTFVALTAIIFISQIGPLSGYSVGKHSQTKRLQAILAELNILQDEKFISAKADVNDELENEVASILEYLNQQHGQETVKALFPEQFKNIQPNHWSTVKDLMSELGLDYRSKWERRSDYEGHNNDYFSYRADQHQPRQVQGYYWHVTPAYSSSQLPLPRTDLPYTFIRTGGNKAPAILVKQGNETVETIPLTKALEDIQQNPALETETNLDPESLSHLYESDRFAAKIYFTSIWGNDNKVNSFDVEVYLRMKE